MEMMKVIVERTIMEREKKAKNWARLLVQGYSRVFQSQLLARKNLWIFICVIHTSQQTNLKILIELLPKSSSSAVSIALIFALKSMSFSFCLTSTSGKYLRAQQASEFLFLIKIFIYLET